MSGKWHLRCCRFRTKTTADLAAADDKNSSRTGSSCMASWTVRSPLRGPGATGWEVSRTLGQGPPALFVLVKMQRVDTCQYRFLIWLHPTPRTSRENIAETYEDEIESLASTRLVRSTYSGCKWMRYSVLGMVISKMVRKRLWKMLLRRQALACTTRRSSWI